MQSRYAMNERQAREKERYQSKEREEVVRKARELKAAELKVRDMPREALIGTTSSPGQATDQAADS